MGANRATGTKWVQRTGIRRTGFHFRSLSGAAPQASLPDRSPGRAVHLSEGDLLHIGECPETLLSKAAPVERETSSIGGGRIRHCSETCQRKSSRKGDETRLQHPASSFPGVIASQTGKSQAETYTSDRISCPLLCERSLEGSPWSWSFPRAAFGALLLLCARRPPEGMRAGDTTFLSFLRRA